MNTVEPKIGTTVGQPCAIRPRDELCSHSLKPIFGISRGKYFEGENHEI